jgi:hypothetical protein
MYTPDDRYSSSRTSEVPLFQECRLEIRLSSARSFTALFCQSLEIRCSRASPSLARESTDAGSRTGV